MHASNELLINVEPAETRVALVEDGVLTELHVERSAGRSIVGNIYHGKVGRVLGGMQACFVDIGLERQAFLQVSDAIRHEDFQGLCSDEGGEGGSARLSKSTPISEVLKAGQTVLVQVSRAPMGRKGARVTSHVSLPGRLLVFLPTLDQIGISRRILDEGERKRLRTIVEELAPGGGVIVRTVAEGASKEELVSDMEYLTDLWAHVIEGRAEKKAPSLVHEDLDLPLRAARDLLGDQTKRLLVDDEAVFNKVQSFAHKLMPSREDRICLYSGNTPLFASRRVEKQAKKALARVIPLPSGGTLVFDHAEALTAIDVNTGRFAGGKDLEDTITQTNLEAVQELAYQLRLRNIGGLIVVDFIDMDDPANRDRVNTALEKALAEDKTQTTVNRISELGLVEMTRKGSRESLSRQLFEPCFYCDGRGQLKSRTTISCEILRELRRTLGEGPSAAILTVDCHPEVAHVLTTEHGEAFRDLRERFAASVEVNACEGLHLEGFDIKGGGDHGKCPEA